MKHYKELLSAYLNHELSGIEKQEVAEHLMQCESCRREHDRIKFGVEMAGYLDGADTPRDLWPGIDSSLNGATADRPKRHLFDLIPFPAFAAVGLVIVLGVAFIGYKALRGSSDDLGSNNPPLSNKQPGWRVETISGSTQKPELGIGDVLETDGTSHARISVADIGNVEIAPNSRVRLVNTESTEHRLSLDRGSLQAMILAPPRLFIVDTPSAKAVDLGCAYKLDVDGAGNSRLHVTSGYVSLERDGWDSIVPAGAIALTRKDKGVGTPYFEDAPEELKKALFKFDFENGGKDSLDKVLAKSRPKDTLTLWHLLRRVGEKERERVYEIMLSFARLPEGVTKEGILKLDKKMLDEWKLSFELTWYQ
jgi:hypothetical protein